MVELTSILGGLAFVVGGLILVLGALALVLTLAGLALALIFLKTKQILIPGTTLFILTLLEAPIRYLLWVFRIEEDVVSKMVVEVRNRLYQKRYEETDPKDRAIFLPQCLRSPKCPAPLSPEGIKCMNCGRCGIGMIKDEAEQMGSRVFIAPGSSFIKRMIKKYRPKAVLGVGCHMEVKEGTAKMASYGLPVQGVLLERDGCVDTRVDATDLLEMILARPGYKISEDEEALERARKLSELWVPKDTEVEIVTTEKP